MHQGVTVVGGLEDYLVDVFGACAVLAGRAGVRVQAAAWAGGVGGAEGPGGELCGCIVHAAGGPGHAAAVEVFAGVMV